MIDLEITVEDGLSRWADLVEIAEVNHRYTPHHEVLHSISGLWCGQRLTMTASAINLMDAQETILTLVRDLGNAGFNPCRSRMACPHTLMPLVEMALRGDFEGPNGACHYAEVVSVVTMPPGDLRLFGDSVRENHGHLSYDQALLETTQALRKGQMIQAVTQRHQSPLKVFTRSQALRRDLKDFGITEVKQRERFVLLDTNYPLDAGWLQSDAGQTDPNEEKCDGR